MLKLRNLDSLLQKKPGIKGRKVLLRVDLNVPMIRGRVSDDTRIRRLLPTFQALLKQQAKIIVISHFGRPQGEYSPACSLAPIADALSNVLAKDVKFGVDCTGPSARQAVDSLKNGEIILLENLRFHKGEKENNPKFAKELASLGDVFVNDAFSCSHRAHASIVGVAKYLPSFAGYLLKKELESLEKVLKSPKKPMLAIVGGSKVFTKLELLETLAEKVDIMAIGGGMANTFLYAQGKNIGTSLCEKDMKASAIKILKKAASSGCRVILPTDVVIADELKKNIICEVVGVDSVPTDKMILDIGPQTVMDITEALKNSKTVIWNGPMGAFEYSPFDVATVSISRIIASLTRSGEIVSIAGGGDVLSALSHSGLQQSFTYISTAGGAFLEWLEGKELPGVKSLMEK